MKRRYVRTVALLVHAALVAGVGLWGSGALARPEASSLLERSFEKLGTAQMQEACDSWMELLDHPWPYGAIAVHQLEIWHEACAVSPGLVRVEQRLTGVAGSPYTLARARRLALNLWKKWGEGLGEPLPKGVAAPIQMLVLRPVASVSVASPLARTLALTGVPLQSLETGDSPSVAAESVLRRTEWALDVPNAGIGVFLVPATGGVALWLDGRPLGVRYASRPASKETPWALSANLGSGTHRLVALDSPGPAAAPPVMMAWLGEGAAALESFASDGVWSTLGRSGPCRESDWICLLADLAEAPWDEPLPSDLYQRLLQGSSPAVALTWMKGVAAHAPTDPRVIGILEAATKGNYCTVDVLWAQVHLREGRLEEARSILDGLDGRCQESAEFKLALIELTLNEGFSGLAFRQAQEAHRQYPRDCRITQQWARGAVELGTAYRSGTDGVACVDVVAEQARDAGQWGVSQGQPIPEDFELPETPPAWLLRAYLAQMFGKGREESVRELLSKAPNLIHAYLSLLVAEDAGKALDVARMARQLGALASWERLLAGKLGGWDDALAVSADPFEAIAAYKAASFAPESPQVLVLEETVAIPDADGWMTVVETAVYHLVSPTSVEEVGEIVLESGRERLMAGVVKADGEWVPADRSEVGEGDALSFKTLSPGDFLVLRTAREVPPEFSAGSCHLLSTYSLGSRSMPVHRARLVVRLSSPDLWRWEKTPGVQVRNLADGLVMFSKEEMAPAPLEPGAPQLTDGLEWVQLRSSCLTWPNLRDALADRLLSRCNSPLPAALQRLADDPVALARAVAARVVEDGSDWSTRDFSDIWEKSSGSVGMAAWCVLMAAGFDAWPVAVNSAELPGFQPAVPGWGRVRGLAIRLRQGQETLFLAPQNATDPRMLPAAWLGRLGVLLRPLDPRLFIEMPTTSQLERQDVVLDLVVGEVGKATGRLTIRSTGSAAVSLTEKVSNAIGEELASNLSTYLRHFLPGGLVVSHSFQRTAQGAELELDVALEQVPDRGFRVLLPPKPPAEWTALASRTQPLGFPGLVETRIELRIRHSGGRRMHLATQNIETVAPWGKVLMKAESEDDEVRLVKHVAAPPRRVVPEEYRAFAEFVALLAGKSSVEVLFP